MKIEEESLQSLTLQKYYFSIFPLKLILEWLTDGSKKSALALREFSFTLKNDIYVRYLSFESARDFQQRLGREAPLKIDIGAIYNIKPSDRKVISAKEFKPVERELVFDIDMTDYDDVRTCCQEKSICNLCWKFLVVAVKVIDGSLRQDFGFSNLLWVFSGRRGVHCWVSDLRARKMSTLSRKSVLSYIEKIKPNCHLDTKRNFFNYPSTIATKCILQSHFDEIIIQDQKLFSTSNLRSKILDLISDSSIRSQIMELWHDKSFSETSSPSLFWNSLSDFIELKYMYLREELMFQLLYPRLDSNVSIQLNHLLKSPFCIHPSTGKVCVPFDPKKIDIFDLNSVPSLDSLAIDSSIINPYLDIFNSFIKSCRDATSKHLVTLKKNKEKELSF